jgi:hypothetical protein
MKNIKPLKQFLNEMYIDSEFFKKKEEENYSKNSDLFLDTEIINSEDILKQLLECDRTFDKIFVEKFIVLYSNNEDKLEEIKNCLKILSDVYFDIQYVISNSLTENGMKRDAIPYNYSKFISKLYMRDVFKALDELNSLDCIEQFVHILDCLNSYVCFAKNFPLKSLPKNDNDWDLDNVEKNKLGFYLFGVRVDNGEVKVLINDPIVVMGRKIKDGVKEFKNMRR